MDVITYPAGIKVNPCLQKGTQMRVVTIDAEIPSHTQD